MLELFIFTPLLGILILNLIPKEVGQKACFGVGVALTVAQAAAALSIGILFWRAPGVIISQFFTGLSVDFFSVVIMFTIGLVGFVSTVVSARMPARDRLNFSNILLVALIGMNGAVMVTDLFSLYVFLEITAICAFILIALFRDREGLGGSFKYLVMSSIATVLLLLAIALIYLKTGDLRFDALKSYFTGLKGAYPIEIVAGLILFMGGLSIKAGLTPFNGWLPDAYASAPSAVSILLAGIITKVAGVYAIMRLLSDVLQDVAWVRGVFLALALLTIVAGAFAAIGQTDFKRMLAFSSVSQVGYIILGVTVGTPLGFAGALLHFFNHAVFKSLLFVNATAVEEQTGERDIRKMGGLASVMRVTGGSSVVGFLSAAGIPPLSGFWSKLLIIIALWSVGQHAAAIIALLASVLTLSYFLILQRKVFFGKLSEDRAGLTEARLSLRAPAILLSTITIAVGLLFPLVLMFLKSQGML